MLQSQYVIYWLYPLSLEGLITKTKNCLPKKIAAIFYFHYLTILDQDQIWLSQYLAKDKSVTKDSQISVMNINIS